MRWRIPVAPQMLTFGLVGVAGFLVDTATLYAMMYVGVGIRAGRIVSYLTAVTTTWALNRRYTFRRPSGHSWLAEWTRYSTSQIGGAAVNLGLYYLLIRSAFVAGHPVIGVAAGSLAGMLVNFELAKLFVFREGRANARNRAATRRGSW